MSETSYARFSITEAKSLMVMAGEQWSDDQIAEMMKRKDVKSVLPSPAEYAKWVANARRIIDGEKAKLNPPEPVQPTMGEVLAKAISRTH